MAKYSYPGQTAFDNLNRDLLTIGASQAVADFAVRHEQTERQVVRRPSDSELTQPEVKLVKL